MLTPPLVTFPDRTKNRLSGVSLRMQLLVSFEIVVMTPGPSEANPLKQQIYQDAKLKPQVRAKERLEYSLVK